MRLVSDTGCLHGHTRQSVVSRALAQEWIGLEPAEDGVRSPYDPTC